jgi:hypothetical protein
MQWAIRCEGLPVVTAVRRALAIRRKHHGLINSSHSMSLSSHRVNRLAFDSVAECVRVVCGGRGALIETREPSLLPSYMALFECQ